MATGALEGKVAIVTGAGSNIGMGRVMALALVNAGARVTMMDVDEDSVEQTANDARELAGDDSVHVVIGDVSSPDDAQRCVRETIDRMGGLHVLVNNAGISLTSGGLSGRPQQPFWDLTPEAWNRMMAVNLTGPFLLARAAVRHMMEQQWGRIIGVTTSMDTMYRAYGVPYGQTKAGHEAFIAAIAQELEDTGVTANVLVPGGAANTNFFPTDTDRDRTKLVQPEVMRAPIVWLASEASDGYNGMRFIGARWDETVPLAQRIEASGAPAAWPQLGRQAIRAD